MASTQPRHDSPDVVDRLIERLRTKGVVLWTESGWLRYRAPKGLLNFEEFQILRQASYQIAARLSSGFPSSTSPMTPRSCLAPLSFSQLAHWHLRQEDGGRPVRQIASATRLLGRIHVELLAKSVVEVVRRHDALRTHVVVSGGIPMQAISENASSCFEVLDAHTEGQQRNQAILRHIERAILDVSDYATDPLFKAVLLRLDDRENVLILALEHIISDGYSANLLSAELFEIYTKLILNKAIDLPPVEIQFGEYATQQRAEVESAVERLEWKYRDYERTRFPDDLRDRDGGGRQGWEVTRFQIGTELKHELQRWAKAHGTTLVITAFVAYAAAVLRWCDTAETVLQFMCDGRSCREFERTIGYLAYPLYIPVVARESDRLVDLLATVTEVYCDACDCPDFAYAYSRYPRPEFTRNTTFNWLPFARDALTLPQSGIQDRIECSPFEFKHPLLERLAVDQEPIVAFWDRGQGVIGEVLYPKSRFSRTTMERFARCISGFLTNLLESPESLIRDLDI